MKKEYKDLELETVRFEAEDVITASAALCEVMDEPCECVRGLEYCNDCPKYLM